MDFFHHSRLHLGSKGSAFKKAKFLRANMTEAEIVLWNALRNNRINGFKFRRQHAIKGYIADFYCHEAKLIVEVDGEIHTKDNVKEHDEGRSFELNELEIKVIRFTNHEIMNSLEDVLQRIFMEISRNFAEHK